MKQKLVAVSCLAIATMLTACASVRIARINADPSRYYHRTVRVEGRVVTSVGLLGTGGYEIDDGSGRIYVVSRTGVPSGGSRVSVTGTVAGGAQILGQTVGTVIREDHHRVKD
jgi:hypothetical protein